MWRNGAAALTGFGKGSPRPLARWLDREARRRRVCVFLRPKGLS
jgi:hypothetical protein